MIDYIINEHKLNITENKNDETVNKLIVFGLIV